MKERLRFLFGETGSAVHFNSSIGRFSSDSGVVLVFDRNTARIPAFAGLASGGGPTSGDGARASSTVTVTLPPGERGKSWAGVRRILDSALNAGLARDGLIVGIGGGVVCDLVAFAASLYMRGCRLILVPTSLLAMVDAAIGGKTAINYGGYKNMAGTFYPAERIIIDVSVLTSLSGREYRSGLGEVIKTALLGDRALLDLLSGQKQRVSARDPALMEQMVRSCIAVKAAIVAEDLREHGQRAILNLGHTFAHAVEAATRYKLWTHGQAVAWGLVQAARLSERLGLADSRYTGMVRDLVRAYGFELHVPLKAESIVQAMHNDKKRREGKLRLVLQRGIGDTVVRAVDPQVVVDSLRSASRNFS